VHSCIMSQNYVLWLTMPTNYSSNSTAARNE
jgi:hypothetical protein